MGQAALSLGLCNPADPMILKESVMKKMLRGFMASSCRKIITLDK